MDGGSCVSGPSGEGTVGSVKRALRRVCTPLHAASTSGNR